MLCGVLEDSAQGRDGCRVLALPQAVSHLMTEESRAVLQGCRWQNV